MKGLEESMETCNQAWAINLEEKYVRKLQYKKNKTQIYLLWVEMGHHALALGAPLNGMGALAQWRNGREGGWMTWKENGLKALTQVA